MCIYINIYILYIQKLKNTYKRFCAQKIEIMVNKNLRNWLVGILVLVVLAFGAYLGGATLWVGQKYDQKDTAYDELNNAYEIMTKDATRYKNELGEERTRNKMLVSGNSNLLLQLRSRDTLILGMQRELTEMRKYLKDGGTITGITQSTSIGVKTPTVIDNTKPDPVYRSKFNLDGWAWGDITAQRDTTYLNMKMRSELYITHGSEKSGFLGLGKRIPFVDVVDRNPYNITTNTRSFAVTKKRISFDYGLGGTIGATTLLKDGRMVNGFGATVGATFNISYR